MTSVHAGIVHQPQGQTTLQYLPLEQVKVNAWAVDVSSHIVLAQTFYNPSDVPTGRAKYVFPLPASAAVCAFQLEMGDGSVVIGEVKEKEEAALMFTHATEQGKAAALVERVTDDIFTISVGSIPPTTRVTACLTFVMDLLDEGLGDHVRLQLPMHIAERYGTPPAALQDAATANARTRIHINVDIQTSGAIHRFHCTTHEGVIFRRYKKHSGQKSQRRMSAAWESSEFLTSDFVITIYAEELDKPRCFAEVVGANEHGDGVGSTVAMQLTLVPKFFAPKVPSQEYIFVIDRSYSMSNDPIETAKRTLTMLLSLLPTMDTTFNILSFGSHVSSLWQKSRALDPNSRSEATAHVASMSADMPGTEIPLALQAAFNSRGLDRPTVVFLLADGQVNVHDALDPFTVVSNAIRNSPPEASVRLFVLGIGTGVSSDVCSKLAREGKGEYMFALRAEDIIGKCSRLLNAGRSQNIEKIDIHWGDDALNSPQVGFSLPTMDPLPKGILALAPPPHVQQAPHTLTRIFSGIRFTVFAIASFTGVPKTVSLIYKLEGVSKPQKLTVPVIKVKAFRYAGVDSIVPMVHSLAARKLIMELDDGVGLLPTPPGDTLLASEDDLRKAGIVRLGLTYQLVSKHTSFVAVRKGDERMRGRRRGYVEWARSRLRRTITSPEAAEGNAEPAAEDPTFLDSLIDGVASFVTSVFGFLVGPITSTSKTMARKTSSPDTRRQLGLPGAYVGSGSSTDEDDRGRGRSYRSGPTRRRRLPSRRSADTFSTMSSFDGSSSCSACWTLSRSPSPPPRFDDPIERAPSPQFLQDPGVPGGAPSFTAGRTTARAPISQEVYNLIREMGVDGSFSASPLLERLVGDAVLAKADELGIDKKVWATAVVVAYMRAHLQGEPDLLELVSDKAKEFVEAFGGTSSSGGGARRFEKMVREAESLLSSP